MNENLERIRKVVLQISPTNNTSKKAREILLGKLNLFKDSTADNLESVMQVIVHHAYFTPTEIYHLNQKGLAHLYGSTNISEKLEICYADIRTYRHMLTRTDLNEDQKIDFLVKLDDTYNEYLKLEQKLNEESKKENIHNEHWRYWA